MEYSLRPTLSQTPLHVATKLNTNTATHTHSAYTDTTALLSFVNAIANRVEVFVNSFNIVLNIFYLL